MIYTSLMEHVKKNILPYTLLFMLLFTAVIWYAVFSESRNGILTVAFLDVGQGDAILTSVTQYTT